MVSHYKQATLLDCGMACVKTIISYYFPKLEHLDSLQFDNHNHQGLSLFEIEGMLKSYGIDADSYQIDTPSLLNNVSFPYLMVVERAGLPHYIVILDGDSNLLTVSDPANEEIEKISSLELFSQSVGIVLIPQKSESVNLEDRKGVVTFSYADKLYHRFLSSLSWKRKFAIFFLGIAKIILPVTIAFFLQITMSNLLNIQFSFQLFSLASIMLGSYLYWQFSILETRLKGKIENDFLNDILSSFYQNQLNDFSLTKNYEYVSSYFWNLLLSATGIMQKFYLKVQLLVFCLLLLLLLKLNIIIFAVTSLSIVILGLYVNFEIRKVVKNQREFIAKSSNFSSLVENTIYGLQDIISFQKSSDFIKEFNERLNELLGTKLDSTHITNRLLASTQIFIGLTGSFLIATIISMRDYEHIAEYANSILILLLLSSILSSLITSWVALKKSQYSFEFIGTEEVEAKRDVVPISVAKIKQLSCHDLSKKWDERLVFNKLNFEFNSGELTVVTGGNGTGKSSLLNIIQGLSSPTEGDIVLNGMESFSTLEETNILDYLSVYSSEFHVFPGSVSKNINFTLFNKENYESNNLDSLNLNVSLSHQIDGKATNISQGQKQKILLMRSLSQEKDIYLFDEPTGNLDRNSTELFLNEVEKLVNEKKIVIVVTHDKDVIARASKVINMDEFH
ncbi:Lipoprotein-releasing system ATP-binding protein LolD [Streptococcus oralis]|uniref:Lipoprotein-releasing system ATP-binding protein LolD n=1 Tax=Streptococcus oralis TaxID=1303 RepID=A0A428I7S1_STROR|nr:ATP-binding cassette domain-containing protein [Streptococcus oralis]RSK08646.1 Lipoprotein-releasing system ATP-binding protein LolD [Streptococcus oralis]